MCVVIGEARRMSVKTPEQQHQQHLPLSTLCRSATLKLRRAAMPSLAVSPIASASVQRHQTQSNAKMSASEAAAVTDAMNKLCGKVNHLHQFVEIVEKSIMGHPQYNRYS